MILVKNNKTPSLSEGKFLKISIFIIILIFGIELEYL